MRFTNMVDSNGNIMSADLEKFSFPKQDDRLNGLNRLRNCLLPALSHYSPSDETFDWIYQPYGFKEYLVWFTKLQYEGDDELVKTSQPAVNTPDYEYQNEEQEAIFKSVHSLFEKGQTNWYLLYAEGICLTRNMYDMEYIGAELIQPMPAYAFFKEFEGNLISKEEYHMEKLSDKLIYRTSGKSYRDHKEKYLFATKFAFPRKEGDALDGLISAGLKKYIETALNGKDKYSNLKTNALLCLNDCRYPSGIFEYYKALKELINSKSDKSKPAVSNYDKNSNSVTVYQGDKKAEIFVCKHPIKDTPLFLINGETFEDMNDVKEYISTGKAFEIPPLWWDEIKCLNNTEHTSRRRAVRQQ